MKRREEMSFLESIYLVEIARGLRITLSKLFGNLSLHVAHALGFKSEIAASASIQYPNQRREYPARFRGRHRLTLHPEGSVRCTSCFLCATACPAKCIYIEAAEHDDAGIEKFPHRYEIDTLLCIYCGYCVEACPVDAIRMDTGLHPNIYGTDPRSYIEDKETLMSRSRLLEDVGPEELFARHMRRMQAIEKDPALAAP
jgi:NADH-quinone oxidoreductase subunit I